MSRHVEFHEAQITIAVKVVEGGRTVDVQRFQLAVLMDTPQEWAQAMELIQAQLKTLREANNGNLGNAEAE